MGLKKIRQFDLMLLLEWTTAAGFLAALFSGAGGQMSWKWEFPTLPRDDDILISWLESNDYGRVELTREENSITFLQETGFLVFPMFKNSPRPPWDELGYPSPTGMSGRSSWTLLKGSPYLLIVGFGMLLLIGFYRKRLSARHQDIDRRRTSHD